MNNSRELPTLRKSSGKFSVLIILTLVGLISCEAKRSAKSIEDQEKPELQLYIFDVGEILVNDISSLNAGEGQAAPVRFANSAYLIRHPKGDLIWDTGFPDSTVNNPLGEPTSAFYSTMSRTLASQLAEIDVKPQEIDFLAVSHLHPDHAGNMNLFQEATLVLQQEEYDSLFNGSIHNPGVDSLRNSRAIKLNGDFDLFGDGSVVIKCTPGHTNGHQVLFVDLPETGPIVLSGDLFLFAKDRESRGIPLFNINAEATRASWRFVEDFLKEKKAKLWVQHDYEQQMALPHSPEVIR